MLIKKPVNKIRLFILALLFLFVSSVASAAPKAPFDPDNLPPAPDYARPSSWLEIPENPTAHPVDVFWVYPTILSGDSAWLMDVTKADLKSAAERTLIEQASVFSTQANLYAPLYRQMNLAGLSQEPAELQRMLAVGLGDVNRAFDYYLEHRNQGRPFILAGHSQGSNILADLMIRRWGRTGAEDRLIAAYLIGWSITPQNLTDNPALKMCDRPGRTGCIVAYNTMAPGRQAAAPTRIPGTLVVNPLSWTMSGRFQPAELNLGAAFFDHAGQAQIYPGFASAQIIDSGLVVVARDPSLLETTGAVFPKGVYHRFDYSLFYENIKANAERRIRAILNR